MENENDGIHSKTKAVFPRFHIEILFGSFQRKSKKYVDYDLVNQANIPRFNGILKVVLDK